MSEKTVGRELADGLKVERPLSKSIMLFDRTWAMRGKSQHSSNTVP